MFVPDEIRKCVVFVCARFASGLRPCGTAFLYASPIADSNRVWVDVVTAKHVLTGVRQRSTDGRLLLRFNVTDGSYRFIETDLGQWEVHPAPEVDVAVLNFVSAPDLDVRFIGDSLSATDDVIAKYRIGIGDDVFITGLFVNHYGSERNIPILRVGNIAAVPSEPVTTGMGAMHAYLIEARSIGGLSGSPVFVYLDPLRQGGGPAGTVLISGGEGPIGGRFFLLGLIHGHYDVRSVTDLAKPDGLKDEAINMGIAIVVPFSRIRETISQPERIALRRKAADQLKRQEPPARGSTNPGVS